MTEPGGAVEVVGATPTGVAGLAALPKEVKRFLTSAAEAIDVDDETAELAMLGQVLAGESLEDILGDKEVAHLKDWTNREVTVHGFRWQRSDYTEGVGVYMVLDVSDGPRGDRFPMTCGSKMCMAQVFALNEKQMLPVEVTITRAEKPTKNGYYPFRLTLPERPFADE